MRRSHVKQNESTDESKAPSVVFDPFDPGFRENPFPTLHRLRESEPVHRMPFGWLLTRYRDCANVVANRSFGMRGIKEILGSRLGNGAAFDFISNRFHFIDPPDHTRLRSLTTKAFSAQRILQMRPQIQALADRLLDRLADAQEFDVIESVAHPLPSWVICQMLSIPFEDDARLSAWTAAITGAGIGGDGSIQRVDPRSTQRRCRIHGLPAGTDQ
jgi:cytochrome P450